MFTGLSGSGKSSLAFDTIYAEGQRRYVESLSAYARQFLGQMDKPDVDFIEGLSPAISIDQKSASRNPRSTVGTVTEVYDYLRLLFARVGIPHDPETGEQLVRQTPQQIVDQVLRLPDGTRFQVLAPVVRGRKGTYETLLADLAGQGFVRAIVDGELIELGGRTPRTRPLRTARHPSRRRSAGPPRRNRTPTHRLDGDRPGARRGGGRDRDRPAEGPRRAIAGPDLQPASVPPVRRQELRGTGAPQLLVQLALRRLHGVRRAGHGLRGRSRTRRPQSRSHHRRRGDQPLGRWSQPLLRSAGGVGGQGQQDPHRQAVAIAEGPTPVVAAQRRRQRAGHRSLPKSLRAGTHLQRQLRGHPALSEATAHRGRVRIAARADRGLHAARRLSRLWGRPAEPPVAGLPRRRVLAGRPVAHVDSGSGPTCSRPSSSPIGIS